MTVRLRVPRCTKALMRFSGMPHSPKPPSRILAPSGMRATAASALSMTAGTPPPLMRLARLAGADFGADVLDGVLRRGTGAEEPSDAQLLERGHIVLGHDAAAGDEHVARPLGAQELEHAREQRHVRARQN